jgi:L-asparagine transporter-like permease
VAVSIGAVLAAASAINATLFATARLVRRVADDGELPSAAASVNVAGIPDRAVIALGATAAGAAVIGSLATS